MAVEYYSGMNDEKYIHYTERIQNLLVKPYVLKLMKQGDTGEQQQIKQKTLSKDEI